MNRLRRVGSILGAAAAALTLCAGPAAAVGQPAAPAASGSTLAANPAASVSAGTFARTFTLVSNSPDAAGKCLDVWDWGNGPWIQMWGCHGGSNQSWNVSFNSVSNGYQIQSNASGKCIDGWRGRGQQVVQLPCDNSKTQTWILSTTGGPWHLINAQFPGSYPLPMVTGQCLDIYDWGRGDAVQLWDCASRGNQEWWYN
ncbi:RICIN domain-containing protein [Kitasatospora sp. NPDC057965]|uniref:RICIN domain-containing protein n=1 Tax=Kitasatospora sp. NPDC057965 TaxID=3346291 RepID=UPI0036D76FAD